MERVALRTWLLGRRDAEARERDLQKASTPQFETLLSLITFAAEVHGWPLPIDRHEIEQDQAAYDRLSKLRNRASSK